MKINISRFDSVHSMGTLEYLLLRDCRATDVHFQINVFVKVFKPSVEIMPGPGSATVRWTRPKDIENRDIQVYQLRYKRKDDQEFLTRTIEKNRKIFRRPRSLQMSSSSLLGIIAKPIEKIS